MTPVSSRSLKRLILFPTLALAAVLLAVPGSAEAQSAPMASPDMTVHSVVAPAQEVREYWTEERMRNALPSDLLPLGARPVAALSTRASTPQGAVLVATSGLPGDEPREEHIPPAQFRQGQLQGKSARTVTRAGTHPFAFTRYAVFPESIYTVYPHSAIGKLFHTVPGFGDFVCTAAAVNSANRSVIWTAGHCVGSFGIFHENLLFVPARRDGEAPFGTWTAQSIVVPPQWLFGFLAEYDYGAIIAAPGGNEGTCLTDTVGFLGFMANAPREQHWHLFGYPAMPPDDGETMDVCVSAYGGDDLPTGGPGDPPTRSLGCNHTAGTSGGPWLVDYSGEPGMTNLLNGSSSYRYTSPPAERLKIYGPYYGARAAAVREEAQHRPVPGCG